MAEKHENFMDEYHATTEEINGHLRKFGGAMMHVAPAGDQGPVHIHSIMSSREGQGHASHALKHLTGLADKHAVALSLDAHPEFKTHGLKKPQLKAWYERHGFQEQPRKPGFMIRSPKEPMNKAVEDDTPPFAKANQNGSNGKPMGMISETAPHQIAILLKRKQSVSKAHDVSAEKRDKGGKWSGGEADDDATRPMSTSEPFLSYAHRAQKHFGQNEGQARTFWRSHIDSASAEGERVPDKTLDDYEHEMGEEPLRRLIGKYSFHGETYTRKPAYADYVPPSQRAAPAAVDAPAKQKRAYAPRPTATRAHKQVESNITAVLAKRESMVKPILAQAAKKINAHYGLDTVTSEDAADFFRDAKRGDKDAMASLGPALMKKFAAAHKAADDYSEELESRVKKAVDSAEDSGEGGKSSSNGKPTLPSDDAAFKSLDHRLGQEMARAASDYDEARGQLKSHHAKMTVREALLVKQIAALQPSVDGLLDGTGPGMTKSVAKDALKYMELNAQLHRARQGQRLAYGAVVDPGQQRLGGAIGDPSPRGVPSDLSGKGTPTPGTPTLKGVKLAIMFKAVSHDVSGQSRIPAGSPGGGKWTKGAGASTSVTAEYTIAHHRLAEVQTLCDKLTRTAAKLNLKPVTCKVVKETETPGEVTEDDPFGGLKMHRMVTVQIAGEAPKVNGWHFVGSLEHLVSGKTIIRTVPGGTIPTKFRTKKAWCDHCSKERLRNDTYVVQNEGGEVKQVGKTCLKDFTGHANPHAIVSFLEEMGQKFNDIESSGDEEDRAFGGGSRRESFFKPADILELAVAVIRDHGFVSVKAAQEDATTATKELITLALYPPKGNKDSYRVLVTDADKRKAKKIIAWVKKQPASWYNGNEYKSNLHTYANEALMTDRGIGIVASMASMYDRETEKEHVAKKVAKNPPAASDYVGTVGDRIPLSLEIMGHRTYDGNYGTSYIYNFQDGGGNHMTWFGSQPLYDDNGQYLDATAKGTVLSVKATIKGHQVSKFSGQKETLLTRVAIEKPKPAKVKKSVGSGPPDYPKPMIDRLPMDSKAVVPPFKIPSFKIPSFKSPKPAGGPAPKSPLGQPAPALAAAPANHLDSAGLADSIGGNLHEVKSRMVKPMFGKPQEQFAHMMSHSNPKSAIAALHAHLTSQGGKMGAIHEQRVPHADGGVGHLYSFDHTDTNGAKHTINMMRTASISPSLKPKNGAAPLPHLATPTP